MDDKWMIITVYAVGVIIGVAILYHIIRAAVKSALEDVIPKKHYADMTPSEKLHYHYERNDIPYEEYNFKMKELKRLSDLK
jgi:hypothetical protein